MVTNKINKLGEELEKQELEVSKFESRVMKVKIL